MIGEYRCVLTAMLRSLNTINVSDMQQWLATRSGNKEGEWSEMDGRGMHACDRARFGTVMRVNRPWSLFLSQYFRTVQNNMDITQDAVASLLPYYL